MTTHPPDMKVRLSTDLRRKVEAAARANNRTLNAEIVSRLEQTFAPDDSLERRVRVLEQDYVSAEEFADFKLLVEATYRRK